MLACWSGRMLPALRTLRSHSASRGSGVLLRHGLAQQQRPLLHLPALGAIASLALKKVALNSVVRKLGVKRVFAELRGLNNKLHAARPDLHGAASCNQIDAALTTLDASVQGLRESDQVQQAWKFFESLEKENPRLYQVRKRMLFVAPLVLAAPRQALSQAGSLCRTQVLVKSYLDTLSPVKWASALLKDPASPTPTSSEPASASALDLSRANAEGSALLKKLHAAAPELTNYHVILVPKSDVSDAAGEERASAAASAAARAVGDARGRPDSS